MIFPIEIEGNLVSVVCTGEVVTHRRITETMLHFIANAPRYRGKTLLILDPGSEYNPTIDEVRRFAGLLRQALGEVFAHAALVVSRDLHYGLGRMTEVITGSREEGFQVFRAKEDALGWLNQVAAGEETGGA